MIKVLRPTSRRCNWLDARCDACHVCHVSAPGSDYWRCDAGPASELEAGDNLTGTGGGFSAASPARVELWRQVCCHHCSLYQHLYHHNLCCQRAQRILDKNTFSLAPFVQMSDTNHKSVQHISIGLCSL